MIRKQRSTDRSVTKVTFVLPDDGQDVSVIADFNSWNPHAHPLKPRPNGTRSIQVALAAGTQARFRVFRRPQRRRLRTQWSRRDPQLGICLGQESGPCLGQAFGQCSVRFRAG
jgi:1,4-alpha-glucan branching enzyme